MISAGRLDLGVGSGWLAKEYEAAGLDFGERGRLLDDALEACTALWAGGPTDFDSPRLRFDDVYCAPRPVQEGGVPFWIGGDLHRRNLARLVRRCGGWIPSPTARRRDIAAGIEVLDAALAEAGRDPGEVRVRIGVPPPKGTGGVERSIGAARRGPRPRRDRLLRPPVPPLPRPGRGPRLHRRPRERVPPGDRPVAKARQQTRTGRFSVQMTRSSRAAKRQAPSSPRR